MKSDKLITLLFEVIDTGIGITPEVRARLFQPFSQGDISTSRKYGGTGLGLAISKRLVEIMGGTLDAESFPGRGTRFWFTIQLTECTAPVSKTVYELIPELRGSHLLCVDDNAINREIIKRQIDSWQMHCDAAVNAAEALSMLKKAANEKNPYALAIIDYMMPGMTGTEMVQIMRQLDGIAATPVILVSSLGTSFNHDELTNLGISLVLTKPLRQGKLYESISAVLKSVYETGEAIIAPEQPQQAKSARKKGRVLLVEDNVINQQVASRMLNKIGYHPDIAVNGLEAVKAMENGTYDIILMDCQMPEMDGYTATEEIRKLEKERNAKSIPIIAMTAHALKGDREKCLQVGMDDYLSKPIDMKTLTAAMDQWLEGKIDDTDLMSYTVREEDLGSESDAQAAEGQQPETKEVYVDMDRITEIFGNETDAIKTFLQSFVAATSELLVSIDAAIQEKDSKASKELFHRLKGSAGNSGIPPLHKLSREAEEKVLQEDWQGVEKIYEKIAKAFENLQTDLAAKKLI